MKTKSVMICGMILLFLSTSNGLADLSDGLVGYWSFNDISDLGHDDSGSENDGTVYGDSSTAGIIGNALSFDGINDYVLVPVSDSLDLKTEGTVAGWVNIPSTFPFPTRAAGFVNKMLHSTGQWSICRRCWA